METEHVETEKLNSHILENKLPVVEDFDMVADPDLNGEVLGGKTVEKVLDKRMVDGKEAWYLVKWKTEQIEDNTWLPVSKLPSEDLVKIFEATLAEKDPEEEFSVETVLDKKLIDGEVYYKVKWLGFPDSDSTWEPSENIFARDLIEEYEACHGQEVKGKRRRKNSRQDDDFFPEEDIVAAQSRPRRREPSNRRKSYKEPFFVTPAAPAKRGRKPARKLAKERLNDVYHMVDDFYAQLAVRVPPCSYDTSDFDDSHLFHVRMSNYLSWLVVEHHICVFDTFKGLSRIERKNALIKRLRQFSIKEELIEIISERESGIWDAIICMNPAKRKMETERMRRFLRDNESVPLPLDWPIMKYVGHVDLKRRQSYGFELPIKSSSIKSPPKKRGRPRGKSKKKQSPKKRRKKLTSSEEEDSPFEDEHDVLRAGDMHFDDVDPESAPDKVDLELEAILHHGNGSSHAQPVQVELSSSQNDLNSSQLTPPSPGSLICSEDIVEQALKQALQHTDLRSLDVEDISLSEDRQRQLRKPTTELHHMPEVPLVSLSPHPKQHTSANYGSLPHAPSENP